MTLVVAAIAGLGIGGSTAVSLAIPASEPRTSITISGARPGPTFDGVGAISGGGGTARLLIDYPEPERSQILDYLFKPGFGADVQVLKMEIGGDAEATDAAEPSFEHTRGHINCNAGYEMWLAQQARARNKNIKLYALQWNAPGWVGDGVENPWTKTDYGYLLSWLRCAKRAGLKINYLGGWNEHLPHGRVTPAIMRWFVGERALLNAHGYRYIKIVGVDAARRNPDVSNLLASHPAFARALGVLGYHDICRYPTTGFVCQVPSAALKSGKPIWATEIGALRPPNNGADLARSINNAFIQAKATAIIAYPLVTSMPGGMPEEDRGLVQASQPWSGYYQVSLNSWVMAQTTQVTQPGWRHVAGAAGKLGGHGTYNAYMGSARKAWSLVAQTSLATGPQQVTVHVKGGLPVTTVHVWATSLNPSDPTHRFVRQPDIHIVHGSFTTTLQRAHVYSFTTTSGQGKCGFGGFGAGSSCPPLPAGTPSAMPLPYSTTPSGTTWPQDAYGPDQTLEPWGLEPADGSFEYPSKTSPFFVQTTAGRPDFWQTMRKFARFPYAVFGDYCLGDVKVAPIPPNNFVPAWCGSSPAANYTVSATVRFTKAGQSAGVIARYYRPVTTPIQYFQGYRFVVSASGQWQLLRDSPAMVPPKVLASGSVAALGTSATHVISLTVNGSSLRPSIDGTALPTKVDTKYAIGVAGICTGGWYPVEFSNVTAGP